MDALQVTARLTIHEGKLEEFKNLAAECMRSVRDRDSGTLQYRLVLESQRDGMCGARDVQGLGSGVGAPRQSGPYLRGNPQCLRSGGRGLWHSLRPAGQGYGWLGSEDLCSVPEHLIQNHVEFNAPPQHFQMEPTRWTDRVIAIQRAAHLNLYFPQTPQASPIHAQTGVRERGLASTPIVSRSRFGRALPRGCIV